jgi:hypothetical protein
MGSRTGKGLVRKAEIRLISTFNLVILNEARNLVFPGAEYGRFLAALGMTNVT